MSEIIRAEPGGEVETRGIPGRLVVQGALKRFLPASAGVLGAIGAVAVLFFPLAPGMGITLAQILSTALAVGIEVAGLTLGFGFALGFLKRWLYPEAKVGGRRSVVAGLCSPLYLLVASIFAEGASLLEIGGFSILTGIFLGLAMFFPWLSRSPSTEDELLEIPPSVE